MHGISFLWCQTPGSFQLEADANLSSAAPFRQASIKNLEMLKTSRPKNNQMIACLKMTYSRLFWAPCIFHVLQTENCDFDGLWKCHIVNHTFILMIWEMLTLVQEQNLSVLCSFSANHRVHQSKPTATFCTCRTKVKNTHVHRTCALPPCPQ